MPVGSSLRLDDGEPAIAELVGSWVPVAAVDGWTVSVMPLVLVSVTLVVASSVLVSLSLLEYVTADELGRVEDVSDTDGLLASVVLIDVMLLSLEGAAPWSSVVADVGAVELGAGDVR